MASVDSSTATGRVIFAGSKIAAKMAMELGYSQMVLLREKDGSRMIRSMGEVTKGKSWAREDMFISKTISTTRSIDVIIKFIYNR